MKNREIKVEANSKEKRWYESREGEKGVEGEKISFVSQKEIYNLSPLCKERFWTLPFL